MDDVLDVLSKIFLAVIILMVFSVLLFIIFGPKHVCIKSHTERVFVNHFIPQHIGKIFIMTPAGGHYEDREICDEYE